jgi:hypothetical protein
LKPSAFSLEGSNAFPPIAAMAIFTQRFMKLRLFKAWEVGATANSIGQDKHGTMRGG